MEKKTKLAAFYGEMQLQVFFHIHFANLEVSSFQLIFPRSDINCFLPGRIWQLSFVGY